MAVMPSGHVDLLFLVSALGLPHRLAANLCFSGCIGSCILYVQECLLEVGDVHTF